MFLWLLLYTVAAVLAMHSSKIPVHKVTTKTHPNEIVGALLFDAYSAVYQLGPDPNPTYITNYKSVALLYSGRQSCLDDAAIRYYLQNATLRHKEYPASECTLNTNNHYRAVVTPTPNFHLSVHGTQGRLEDELTYKTQLYLEDVSQCRYEFYNFSSLNYDLECTSNYYELMQVSYKETIVEATLRVAVTVLEECPFSDLNPNFNTEFDAQTQTVVIPVNGTYYCHSGRSPTCRMSLAHTQNARYRLFD